MPSLPKILVMLGPTATGKSDLAVLLAQKHNGEVVSADSRQVYRGLDLVSAKITEEEMDGVPHHLLDVYSPQEKFSVTQYKAEAEKTIEAIHSRGRLPIICGGTGFYIQAIVDNVTPPEVSPNEELREKLSQRTPAELFEILKERDPRRAETIDPDNPHRLIRAIEITEALGEVPQQNTLEPQYNALQIGIDFPDEMLKERIALRLTKRLEAGMIEEMEHLHEQGLSYARMEELGLEARYLARFLQGYITREEMEEEIITKSWQYAKRQRTWFKRDDRIHWFDMSRESAREEIGELISTFLK